MEVQLHQLRYVICVAEERQFTKAAARLHVAQPSVSSAVAALEAELGAALFHRMRGEVVPTAAGEAFLPWARQVVSDCEAGRTAVRDVAGLRRGRLALGATPSLMTNLLPPVLAGFHADHPSIELALREEGSRDLVALLEDGLLDLALLILPVRGAWVNTVPLVVEDLVLAVSARHRLATAAAIDLAELAEVPLVMFRDGYDLREATVSACRQAGFAPTLVAEGLDMDGVLALVAVGLGAAVIPASVATPRGLVTVPFADGTLTRTVGLAWRADRLASPAATAFETRLRNEVASLLADAGSGPGSGAVPAGEPAAESGAGSAAPSGSGAGSAALTGSGPGRAGGLRAPAA
jgi:DNA-binding transcriptional LysR family regulator